MFSCGGVLVCVLCDDESFDDASEAGLYGGTPIGLTNSIPMLLVALDVLLIMAAHFLP
jgi:hypothetical protein